MKMVQVFLKGDDSAEVSGELVKYQVVPEGIWISHREEKLVTEHFFPLLNVHTVRFWQEK